jgi:peptidoglycan hydrolase CwlO-like protein
MLPLTLVEVKELRRVAATMWCLKANMKKVRVLVGVLAVLVLVGSATGCGLVSDQTKQQAKNKVESKAQKAKQDAKKKLAAGREDLQKKVDDLKKKVEAGQEDLKQKVSGVHKDVNDLQKKVDELLKKVDAQKQQGQKAKK